MTNFTLVKNTIIFAVFQIAMVILGHFVGPVRDYYAVGGAGLSFLQGGLLAWHSRARWTPILATAAVCTGISAFLGILVCLLLGDVPATLLAFGTLGSIFAGITGAALGKLANRMPAVV